MAKASVIVKDTRPFSLTDHAGYAAAVGKLKDLRAREAHLRQDAQRIQAELGRTLDGQARLLAEARALLDNAQRPLPDAEAIRRSVADVQHELSVVATAIGLQEREVERQRSEASSMVCRQLYPAHKALAARIAGHLTGLKEALQEERRLIEAFQQEGVLFVSPMRPLWFMGAGDDFHFIDTWLRERKTEGYIS